ncbi:hypothetical protein RYX36_030989, partial [Vicia faba]
SSVLSSFFLLFVPSSSFFLLLFRLLLLFLFHLVILSVLQFFSLTGCFFQIQASMDTPFSGENCRSHDDVMPLIRTAEEDANYGFSFSFSIVRKCACFRKYKLQDIAGDGKLLYLYFWCRVSSVGIHNSQGFVPFYDTGLQYTDAVRTKYNNCFCFRKINDLFFHFYLLSNKDDAV